MEREVMGLAEFASHGRDPCNRLTPRSMPPRRAAIRRPQLLHRCTIAQARACARTLAAELSHAGLGSLHSVTINFLHILKFAFTGGIPPAWRRIPPASAEACRRACRPHHRRHATDMPPA